MKALVYHGPRKLSVDSVPDAKLEKLTDVVIKLTTTNICGSDLHMYEGRTDVEKGKILGHENLGEVVEVGRACRASAHCCASVTHLNSFAALRAVSTARCSNSNLV